MKKNIRIFTEATCPECKQLKTMIEGADIVALDDNIELTSLDIEKDKNEWELVMEKTGVYFVPHIEVTWEKHGGKNDISGKEEVHLSQLRDFDGVKQAFEMISLVLDKEYIPTKVTDVEITETLKSLTFMQQLLFDQMNNTKENFTIIADYINMSQAKLK